MTECVKALEELAQAYEILTPLQADLAHHRADAAIHGTHSHGNGGGRVLHTPTPNECDSLNSGMVHLPTPADNENIEPGLAGSGASAAAADAQLLYRVLSVSPLPSARLLLKECRHQMLHRTPGTEWGVIRAPTK
jgi:hypothetical protein